MKKKKKKNSVRNYSLIINLGADVTSRPSRGVTPAIDAYQVAIEKLEAYFRPAQHEAFSRHSFWSLKKEGDETIDRYVLRLREAASECKFGENDMQSREIAIIDKLIQSSPKELQEKLLQKADLNLKDSMDISHAFYAVLNYI